MKGNLNHCIVKGAFGTESYKRLLPGAAEAKRKAAKGAIGIGIWEGSIISDTQGLLDQGEQIALFSDTEIMCICGPKGDERAEAFAAWAMFMWNSMEVIETHAGRL